MRRSCSCWRVRFLPPQRHPIICGRAKTFSLAEIPRTIAKEPAYQTESPGYCLLVFGLKAKTRVWLVVDGDHVYLDRNGNGDLTEAGECVDKKDCGWFLLGEVTEADGKTAHEKLRIRVWEDSKFSVALRSPHAAYRFVGRDDFARPRLAAKPADAPIIHPNGPITLAAFTPMNFAFRSADETRDSQFEWLNLMAGSRGLGPGTFTVMDGDGVPGLTKGGRTVLAEIEFPARTADAPPILSRQSLRAEGWSWGKCLFAGPVRVPNEAGGGYAKLTLTVEGLEPGETAPATIKALVLGDEADLPAVRAAARKAVPMLVAELQRNHPDRDNAAAALGQFGPAARDAVPALTKALDDQNICHVAARALIQILPPDEAVPLFVPRLQELNASVHSAAAEALGMLGPDAKDATGALVECLKRKRNEYFSCQALAQDWRGVQGGDPRPDRCAKLGI